MPEIPSPQTRTSRRSRTPSTSSRCRSTWTTPASPDESPSTADFTLPEGTGDGEIKGGSLSFDYTLKEVGIDPEIEAPADAQPLSELTQQFAPLLGGEVQRKRPLAGFGFGSRSSASELMQ